MKLVKYTGLTKTLYIFLLILISNSVFAKTYKLGLVEWFPWGIAYVAAEKGFWKAEGIDVKIKQFMDYETENLKAFENQRTDFMLSMLGNAIEMINRKPRYAIIYESDWSHGGDFFILHKDIASIAELKGRKIGSYSKSASISFFASKVLNTANIDISAVRLLEVVNTRDLNQAFRRGKFAAIISYDPEASKVIKQGVGKLQSTSADFEGIIPEGISVQNTILQENPEDVKRFLRGWLRAVQWHTNHRQEFYAILKKTMFKGSSYTNKDFDVFYAGSRIHADLATITTQNEQEVQEYVKELLAYLKQRGHKITSEQSEDYVKTGLSIIEAKQIFK
jgi:NitT/TauT family transport system substrate-binding protein